MNKRNPIKTITPNLIEKFKTYLQEQEKSLATIQKYIHDLTTLCNYLKGAPLNKINLIKWKEQLEVQYAASSVNTILAAVNSLLDYCGWEDLKVKPLKIQKNIFSKETKELSKVEYLRLIHVAKNKGNERLFLLLQTICATGIRVSELKFITVEAMQKGKTQINNKGKCRIIFIPEKLRKLLKKYTQTQKINSGAIFITKTGKPIDRSNIWRDMKALCSSAGVETEKVFPHNLRHLFARTYYSIEKDLSRLADILGHSNVNTTRIYTMESGVVHLRQMNKMGLTSA